MKESSQAQAGNTGGVSELEHEQAHELSAARAPEPALDIAVELFDPTAPARVKLESVHNDNVRAPRSMEISARILKTSGRWLLAGDIMAMLLAFVFGGLGAWAANIHLLEGSFQTLVSIHTLKGLCVFAGLGAIALLWLDTRGHYRQRLPYWESVGHILAVAAVGFLVCGFIQFAAQERFSRLWLGLSWAFFGAFLFAGRWITHRMLKNRGQWWIPAILVGDGPLARAALHALNREPHMGYAVVKQLPSANLQALAAPYAWKRVMAEAAAGYLFIALEGGELERHQAALKSLTRERLPFSIVPPWTGLPSSTLSPHHFMMQDVLLLHDTNRLRLPLPRFLKRGFDIAVAGAALAVLAPLFLAVALAIRSDGGPAFFTQQRVGRHGKRFNCYKFRSMRMNAEQFLEQYFIANPEALAEWRLLQKLKNDVRVTRVGKFIRRTSIDELPQLLNVLKGDMSLVGPRPIMPGQEDYYAEDFTFYESVSPGITGPWQVSGRNALTFNERVALECWYARNWSLWMDIVILLKTVPAVLRRDQAF